MKTSILATAAIAALGISSAANAAVTITVTDLGVPTDGLAAGATYGPLTGYHAYAIYANAGSGGAITGADFSAQGGGSKPITATLAGGAGALHQYWNLNTNSKTGVTTATKSSENTVGTNGAGVYSYDSHLVFDTANVSNGSPDDENNDAFNTSTNVKASTSPFSIYNQNTATGTPSDGWGNGSTIVGANAFNNSLQVQIVQLAYLVIADAAHLTSPITVASPELGATNSATAIVAPIVIPALTTAPEPTSLALMGMASAGLLARRRRNA